MSSRPTSNKAATIAFIAATLLGVSKVAFAQQPAAVVEAGYAFGNVGSWRLPLGWTGSAAVSVTPWLAAAGEIAGAYKAFRVADNPSLVHRGERFYLSFHSFSAGPRVTVWRSVRVGVTAQVLFGGMRFAGDPFSEPGRVEWEFLTQPGGAVTVRLLDRLDMRVALDFLHLPDADFWTRLSVGVAVPLGTR